MVYGEASSCMYWIHSTCEYLSRLKYIYFFFWIKLLSFGDTSCLKCLLSSIIEQDGTLPEVLKVPKKSIWKTRHQSLAPEIPTRWLEIIHRPSCTSKKNLPQAVCLLLHYGLIIKRHVCVWLCVCMAVCECVWLDRIIGPVNVLSLCFGQAERYYSERTVWHCAALWGCGNAISVDFRGNSEEEWGNRRQIGLMVVLREEVERPTAASHPFGPAWRAGLDQNAFGDERTGTFHF